jgi:hypothetical protein
VQVEVQTHGDPLSGRPGEGYASPDNDYLGLVVQFEQRFEEMYLNWLREALAFLENQR